MPKLSGTRITTRSVTAAKPGTVLWDAELKGFGLRVLASGARAYLVKYRASRRQRWLTIGMHGSPWTAEQARAEALRLLGMVREGKDPSADRASAKAAATLAEFAGRYMTEYADRRHKPRTREEEARLLKLHVLPAIGGMKLKDIGKADAARLHAKMHETPIAANRTLALLSSILGWAEKVGERPDGSNPCRHVERYPEKSRERLLSPEELARLGDALAGAEAAGAADWRMVALVRLLLFTGARLSEILGLQWDWIDMQAGTARLPDSKTGAKTLYLSAPALDVLASLPRIAGDAHVLPGDRPVAPLSRPEKQWQRLRKTAGLDDLRLHDLRHGFASAAVAAGDSLFIVGRLLGHKQAATTERYAHLAPDPARAVADRTAERLRAMMQGGKGELIELPGAKRAG